MTDTLYVDPEYEVDLASGTHTIHYFHGSRRVATENRSGLGLPGGPGSHQSWQFYFPDFVGSNAVVARDTGELQKSFFRPFGEFAQEGGGLSPYLFTDQEHDSETDLQYFGARYYDPWVGRFLSRDPELIGHEPGITFKRIEEDAQNLNAYSYALNRPTIMVDVNGEAAWRVAAAVGRVILSGGKIGAEAASIADDVRTVSNSNASTGERVIAGISLASGIPVGWLKSVFKIADKGTDAKSATKAATGTDSAADATGSAHGNSRADTRTQHGYHITDKKTGEVVKTGASGGKRNEDGSSRRANDQANRLNRESGEPGRYQPSIEKEISEGPGARESILKWEKQDAAALREQGHLTDPTKHKRP